MERVTVLHEDKWGSVIDRMPAGYLEIRWFDSTDEMTKDEFQDWLTMFAEEVGANRRPAILVDATRFGMPMDNMDGSWRDEHVIPRYNAAGVRRFAFLMPDGMPAIGSEPTTEGPSEYVVGYFSRRQDALDWLAEA